MKNQSSPFFIDDKFYSDLEDYITDLEIDGDELNDDFYPVQIRLTRLEPMFQTNIKFIKESIIQRTDTWKERFPEESDREFKEIEEAIEKSFDIDLFNSLIPKLYYPTDEIDYITKQDVLDYYEPTPPNKGGDDE